MFIKGIAIFLSSCRNVETELRISKRATQSYFWVTLSDEQHYVFFFFVENILFEGSVQYFM